jgi:hypothetical protein
VLAEEHLTYSAAQNQEPRHIMHLNYLVFFSPGHQFHTRKIHTIITVAAYLCFDAANHHHCGKISRLQIEAVFGMATFSVGQNL